MIGFLTSLIAAMGIACGAAAQSDTIFTYQGLLSENGVAAGGDHDFSCSLWDAAMGGVQIGSLTITDVPVVDGRFVLEVDFGADAFDNTGRWLELAVNGETILPRQPLTRSPYSIQTRGIFVDTNEFVGVGTLTPQHPLHVAGDFRSEGRIALGNDAHIGLGAGPNATIDRIHDLSHTIEDFSSSRVWAPLLCTTTLDPVADLNSSEIYCNAFEAHVAQDNDKDILFITGLTGGAVHSGTGRVVNHIGELVFSESRNTGAISHNTGLGVVAGGHRDSQGVIDNNIGLSISTGHSGLAGSVQSDTSLLVRQPRATQPIGTHYGIYLENQDVAQGVNYSIYSAGGDVYFSGDLDVGGVLSKGGGSFKIDHPLDPENKYLSHSFVESPDMMNIYNGTVVADESGYATITMPDWFESLNRDFRYQLTVVDESDSSAFAQVKVVRELHDGQFTIRTSESHVRVSWQVTGIRQDAFANANRINVEEVKPRDARGRFLHPEAFGLPRSMGVTSRRSPEDAGSEPLSTTGESP